MLTGIGKNGKLFRKCAAVMKPQKLQLTQMNIQVKIYIEFQRYKLFIRFTKER